MNHQDYLKAISESYDQLSQITDIAIYGMCAVDRRGFIIKWQFQELFVTTEEEAIGRHVSDIIPGSRLHITAKTGISELLQPFKHNNEYAIVSRIPLFHEDELIGAVSVVLTRDMNDISDTLARYKRLEKLAASGSSEVYPAKFHFSDIITTNSKMISLKELAQTIAPSKASILIQGESGTGKELFAQSIHNASSVADQPFISINCASIPASLLESELFGYEAGAFTGASKSGRIGKLELAGEGTLFLDELGTMPPEMQVKLLRVLENKEFTRVGGNVSIPFKARVLAATNDNLQESIKNETFRLDLYYRLNVFGLSIPPLRDRIDDIPLLCRYMIDTYGDSKTTSGSHTASISPEALSLLCAHHWPGNVRELRNVMESALILSGGAAILPKHLPEYIQDYKAPAVKPAVSHYYHHEIEMLERRLIVQALQESRGNRQAAAANLGIQRSLLYKKMKEYDIH